MDRRTIIKVGSTIVVSGVVALAGCTNENSGQGSDDAPNSGDPQSSSNGASEEPADQTDDNSAAENESENQDSTIVTMETEGEDYYFDPIGLYIESGETVTFRNESGSHSSTAYEEGNGSAKETRIPDGADAWNSETLSEEGATFDQTFETPGTYDYFCIPHKSLNMVGRIVVDEPSGPAEGSMPPDGDVPKSQTIVNEGTVAYSDFNN